MIPQTENTWRPRNGEELVEPRTLVKEQTHFILGLVLISIIDPTYFHDSLVISTPSYL